MTGAGGPPQARTELARDGKIRLTVTLDLERLCHVLLSAGLLANGTTRIGKLSPSHFSVPSVELWMASEERKLGNYTGSQMPT